MVFGNPAKDVGEETGDRARIMPLAKIHVTAGVYDPKRLEKLSHAVRGALLDVLKAPPDDFFQIVSELPEARFFHPPRFLGHTYTREFILLEVTFGAGRTTETRTELLRELNRRVVAEVGVQPDDLVTLLFEIAYENFSFGRGMPGTAEGTA